MRAKFQCQGVTELKNTTYDKKPDGTSDYYKPLPEMAKYGEAVDLWAVHSNDPNDPNHTWSQATPSGHLNIVITNPVAWGHFEVGKKYYLDFNPAE